MARDPQRIDKVLRSLEILWKKLPDWRLGQLIVNLNGTNSPFFTEDDILLDKIHELLLKFEENDQASFFNDL